MDVPVFSSSIFGLTDSSTLIPKSFLISRKDLIQDVIRPVFQQPKHGILSVVLGGIHPSLGLWFII